MSVASRIQPLHRPHDVTLHTTSSVASRRILHVITPSHLSGAEMQVVRLTHRMQSRGHEVSVLVKHGSPAVAEMRERGCAVETARIGGKINVLALASLARAARRTHAELLHTHLSSASWWSGWLERLGGPKSIGHVHGFTSAAWHRRQSHLIAVSGAVRDDLVGQGIASNRVTVLHNALDPAEFLPRRSVASVRAEFGAAPSTPVIGTFAHLSAKKGYRELFAAMPKIVAVIPSVQLWVMGRGPLRDELESSAQGQGFLGSVRFAGFRPDAADVMNAIDVLAVPSHREPFGLVYIEAALLGKPVVACASGGAPEAVAHGESGILIPTSNSDAIAEAILTLLENPASARRMGAIGRERAQQLFSWSPHLAVLESIYQRVLQD